MDGQRWLYCAVCRVCDQDSDSGGSPVPCLCATWGACCRECLARTSRSGPTIGVAGGERGMAATTAGWPGALEHSSADSVQGRVGAVVGLVV